MRVKTAANANAGTSLPLSVVLNYVDTAGNLASMNGQAVATISGTSQLVGNVTDTVSGIPGYVWFFIFLLALILVITYAIYRMRTSPGHDDHAHGTDAHIPGENDEVALEDIAGKPAH